MQNTKPINEEVKACVQVWMDCHKACMDTISYCLRLEENQRNLSLLCNLRDCAEMCLLCTNLMMDGSEFMGRAGLLCAEMCEKCIRVCEGMKPNPQFTHLIQICRQGASYSQSAGTHATSYFCRDNLITEQSLLNCALV